MPISHEVREALQTLNAAVDSVQTSVVSLVEAVITLQKMQHEIYNTLVRSWSQSNGVLDDLPQALKMKDVAKIMGVCVPKAYDIARRPEFPVIRDGRKLIIPRDAFLEWLNNAAVKNETKDKN